MVERPVVFENEGEQLIGIVHEPEGIGVKPGVILLHGFAGNRIEPHRLFVKMARSLAKTGFYVFRFDFRGSGDSQGEFVDMTISGEISDALAGLNWFKENTGVDPERIGVLGLSMGGCVAAYTAARANIKALVLWSAVALPLQVFEKNAPYQLMINQAKKQGYLEWNGWRIGFPFLEELPSLNPLEMIKEYTGPGLCIHGSGDQVVPIEHSHLYYRYLSSPDKEVYIIEEADHTFNKFEWEQEVIQKTVAWLENKLK